MSISSLYRIGIILALSFMASPALAALATTTDIKALEATILQLQAEAARLQQTQSGAPLTREMTHSFGLGARDNTTGGEVSQLQKLLIAEKGVYPEALVTGYFGPATQRAVQAWQKKFKIVTSGTPATTGYGWVGKRTRESFNKKVSVLPVSSGALSMQTSSNIVASKAMTVTSSFTNKLSAKFLGTGNGTKVVFTQTGMPKGVTVSSSLNCITPCTVENKVTVNPSVSEGVYPISVKATAGSETAIGAYIVQIGEPKTFSFSLVADEAIDVKKSLTGSANGKNIITVRTLSGDPQPVTLTQYTTAKGFTLAKLGACTPPCTKANSVTAGLDSLSGIYPITVIGVGGGATTTLTYNVIVRYNENFGYHVSNQEDIDKQITMTQPVGKAVTAYIPLKFIADGGTPSFARIDKKTEPTGLSVSIEGCTLPCDRVMAVTLAPDVKAGTYSVGFTLAADYFDEVAQTMKTLKKTYTESVRVVIGDSGISQF